MFTYQHSVLSEVEATVRRRLRSDDSRERDGARSTRREGLAAVEEEVDEGPGCARPESAGGCRVSLHFLEEQEGGVEGARGGAPVVVPLPLRGSPAEIMYLRPHCPSVSFLARARKSVARENRGRTRNRQRWRQREGAG